MNTIILSALGTGAYREARYRSEHHPETITTGLFAVALHRWYPEAEVKLLATDVAWEGANGDYVRKHHPDFERVRIPEGRTEAEAWELFGAMTDAVPPGSRVIFDITHGLRSLPMLGFLALSYLRVVRNVTIERVYYGALELTPRSSTPSPKCECCGQTVRQEQADEPLQLTPVVDLTPLVGLLDWASASERFLDTGDARRIATLLEGQPALAAVAVPVRELSDALGAQRPAEANQAAQRLQKEVKKLRRKPLPPEQQQFALALEHIEERFDGIAHGKDAYDSDPVRVLRGQYHQIRFYLRGGQYAQAIELTREWLVSVRLWKAGRASIWPSSARTEAKLQSLPSMTAPEWHTFAALWTKTLPLRNRFAHFHTDPNTEEAPSAEDVQAVQNVVEALAAAVHPLGLDLGASQQGS